MNQPVTVASATFGFAESTGKRKSQQDFLKWSGMERPSGTNAAPRPRLIVLADGMGGHVGGETASRLATAAFIDACPHGDLGTADLLLRGLAGANARLAQAIRDEPALAGMGCTLLAVELAPGDRSFRWISVGDSLLMRVAGARLERLNEDHSFRGEVRAARQRGADTAQLPRGNVLKSAVMGDPIPQIDDDHATGWTDFAGGEALVLATDGIDTLTPAQICEIVEAHPDARAAAAALVAAVDAADLPRQDNTTVAVIRAPARGAGPGPAVSAPAAAGAPGGRGAAATGHWSHGALGTMFALGLVAGGASLWSWQALNPPRTASAGAPTVGADIALPAAAGVPVPTAASVDAARDAAPEATPLPVAVARPVPHATPLPAHRPGHGHGPAPVALPARSPRPAPVRPAPTPAAAPDAALPGPIAHGPVAAPAGGVAVPRPAAPPAGGAAAPIVTGAARPAPAPVPGRAAAPGATAAAGAAVPAGGGASGAAPATGAPH